MENQEETFSFKSLRHRRSWVSGHCFCRRARGLATRLTPRGKVQIKRTRHSWERVIARVVQDCVGALPRLLVPSVRTRSLPRASRFSSVRSSKFQPCRTRRQSQRWDLSRRVLPKSFSKLNGRMCFVVLHAPRQLPAWLIYDVSRLPVKSCAECARKLI
jgi:hypothetical protein